MIEFFQSPLQGPGKTLALCDDVIGSLFCVRDLKREYGTVTWDRADEELQKDGEERSQSTTYYVCYPPGKPGTVHCDGWFCFEYSLVCKFCPVAGVIQVGWSPISKWSSGVKEFMG